MDPAALLRELYGGPSATARTGLFALALGAVVTLMVAVLLSPSMQGLAVAPVHLFDHPVAQPRVVHRPTMTRAQRTAARRAAVHDALTQVGVHERGVNGGPMVLRYRRAVIGRGENPRSREPWCADFVSWAWRRAGAPIGFGGRGSDYVPELVAWARLTRRWHWARDGYHPRAGDLVVFASDGSPRGHIGMVVTTGSGRIHTVEGNYSDRVMRRSVKAWSPVVTGFIAPV
jgi:hypothetical protein